MVAPDHRGNGREIISLDWTFSHHDRGSEIYGNTKSYDYVKGRTGRFQTLVTSVVSNHKLIDGLDVVVQEPSREKEEMAYLKTTVKESYDQMEAMLELCKCLFSEGKSCDEAKTMDMLMPA